MQDADIARRRAGGRKGWNICIAPALLALLAVTAAARGQAPSIIAAPEDQIVRRGGTARFDVTATGEAPLSYHWFLNGSPLVTLSNSTLTVTVTLAEQEGEYSVIASNAFGASLPSATARLIVCSPIRFHGSNVIPTLTNLWAFEIPFIFDAQGNLHIARVDQSQKLRIFKFDREGRSLWETIHSGPALMSFSVFSAAIAPDGSLVVAARDNTGFTERFDAEGHSTWVSYFTGGMIPLAVAVNSDTNIWVSGYGPNGLLVLKQDGWGRQFWSTNYAPGAVPALPLRSALACDSFGNVIVATHLNYSTDLIVAKVDASGRTLWQTNAGVIEWPGYLTSLSVAMNSAGDAFITHAFELGDTPNAVLYTLKARSDGTLSPFVDHRTYGTLRANVAGALDDSGNLYCASTFIGSLLLQKYDPQGTRLWSMSVSMPPRRAYPDTFWVDSTGGLLLAGRLDGSGLSYAPFVARFTQDTAQGLPVIVENLPSYRLVPGSTVTFRARAIGMEPLSYQWRRNARNIIGATNESLSLTNVQVADNGDYSALVTNPAGCIVSQDGKLTVVELLPFGLRDVAVSNGFFSFTSFGEGNRFYWLDESSDLTNWSSWQGISNPNGSWRFSLPINTNARFFRLRTAP